MIEIKCDMSIAFHMRHKKTGEKRIKKVSMSDVKCAFYEVGCSKEWEFAGLEPWRNVSDHVVHVVDGYYSYMDK